MYSSINGNGFGGYGEIVMGTKGTLVLETRAGSHAVQEFGHQQPRFGQGRQGRPDDGHAGQRHAGPMAKAAEGMGKVSRGYTEEIEHWAWCIRNPAPENQPRCKPEVALGDAVIALTTNFALKQAVAGKGNGFVKFDDKWYDLNDDDTPDGSSIKDEYERLVKEA